MANRKRGQTVKKTNIFVLRWRLWWVCKKLGIRPYKWQKDYALGKITSTLGGRRSGKTTAVMLWALIRKVRKLKDITNCAYKDPDTRNHHIRIWWENEYMHMAREVGLITEGPAHGKS